jgi:hypothetical protein
LVTVNAAVTVAAATSESRREARIASALPLATACAVSDAAGVQTARASSRLMVRHIAASGQYLSVN